jgi:hypothetical protein
MANRECAYCGTTEGLRIAGTDCNGRPDDFICAACFTGTDTGPCFDDLPVARQIDGTFDAYRHGLTIEQRDGVWCVTNDFGGRVINTCIDLEDALEMRERAALGVPAHAVELVARLDASKNRAHAAKLAILAATGESPSRVWGTRSDLLRYSVWTGSGMAWGEAYTDEPSTDAVALERLLDSVREGSEHQMGVAAE